MRRIFRIVLAAFMIAIGLAHFLAPGPFASIVPAWLPAPVTLVLVSGFFEIAGGVGLLVPRVRPPGEYIAYDNNGWGVLGLALANASGTTSIVGFWGGAYARDPARTGTRRLLAGAGGCCCQGFRG